MLWTVPLLGAIIGWLTNKIAIILIFRPYEPLTIPLVDYSLQGLLPKRRNQIAADIGEIVEKDLLPVDELLAKFQKPELQKKVIEGFAIVIYQYLLERFPIALPLKMRNIVFQQVHEVIRREAPSLFDKLLGSVADDLKNQVSFKELVQEKIEGLEIKELENLLIKVVAKELRHIEFLGGVLGFLIGIVQVLIVFYL